jgi:hypothetical protein
MGTYPYVSRNWVAVGWGLPAYASRFLEAAGEFRISLLPHASDVGGR